MAQAAALALSDLDPLPVCTELRVMVLLLMSCWLVIESVLWRSCMWLVLYTVRLSQNEHKQLKSDCPCFPHLPGKINSPRRVVSSPRKHPQSPRGVKRGGLAPTSLANFFKVGRPADKETLNTKKNEQAGKCVRNVSM